MQIKNFLFNLCCWICSRLSSLDEVRRYQIVVVFEVCIHLIKECDSHRDGFDQVLVSNPWVFLLLLSAEKKEQLEVRLCIAHLCSFLQHFNCLFEVAAHSESFLVEHSHPVRAN